MKTLALMSCLSIAFAAQANAQIAAVSTPIAASAPTLVPALVPYAGMALAADGKPLAGDASATFLLFKDEKGGEPLWIESQSIAVDATGHYQVKLGASSSNGLPLETFASGEVRWLEVQIAGQPTAPRVLLTSVPYALKAANAATLGGLPASAFVLASGISASPIAGGVGITPDASASNVTTTGGTNFYLPKFSGATTVINSQIYDNGTSVGIGDVPNPSAKLDVNGAMIMRGNMQVTRTGNATTSKGYPSYGFQFYSNAYNSSSKANDNPYFQLQSEPTGNDTASPSATFNLLFSNNGSAPAETGLYINPNGTIHFASGQTFPGGSGTGTITGVTAGTGLTGGGTSGNVTLSLNTATVPTLSGTNTFTGSNIFAPSIYEETDVNIDSNNSNPGNISPGLRFGSASGEGMSSQRTSGTNQYGLDLYTDYSARMSITAAGNVGIGTRTPTSGAQLDVEANPSIASQDAIYASGSSGTLGIWGRGGNTDGSSGAMAGYGGLFIGGTADSFQDAGYGIYASGGSVDPAGIADSAYFATDIQIQGNEVSDASIMKIDHPSDPASKYLVHTSVQSSEMMNMYTGNVTTDGAGHATVALPAWFEAENADFRYQLTVVGQFAQAVVKDEIANGQFTIMTNLPNVKVSWLVTAVRQDAFAKAHPLVVEVAKPAREVGFYRHPELYGQPATKQTEWGRHPRMMQRMEAERAATQSRKPRVAAPAVSVPVRTRDGNPQTTSQPTPGPLAAK